MLRHARVPLLLHVLALAACVPSISVTRLAPTLRLSDGHLIPALALGTWLGNNSLSAAGGEETRRAVEWAIDAGYRHVDTAPRYRVEDQVGAAIRNKIQQGVVTREQLFITTKLWNSEHARDAVVPALRRSLADLQLDYVDLFLIHWPVAQYDNGSYYGTDYTETWAGIVEARRLGLARSIGLSNFNERQVDRILASTSSADRPQVLQVELNLNLQQRALRSYCASHGMLVMGYTPFGSLFDNKALPDAPPPRLDTPALTALARKHNKTVTQVTLRYLHELGVIPIPKSVTKSRIESNIDIFEFELSEQDRETLASFDTGYRTIPQRKWIDNPHYPFEKTLLHS